MIVIGLLQIFLEKSRNSSKMGTLGLLMVLISQSFPEEPVVKDMAEILQKCGIVPGHDMTLPSAVAKMALILVRKEMDLPEKMKLMTQNWQGEIS